MQSDETRTVVKHTVMRHDVMKRTILGGETYPWTREYI